MLLEVCGHVSCYPRGGGEELSRSRRGAVEESSRRALRGRAECCQPLRNLSISRLLATVDKGCMDSGVELGRHGFNEGKPTRGGDV